MLILPNNLSTLIGKIVKRKLTGEKGIVRELNKCAATNKDEYCSSCLTLEHTLAVSLIEKNGKPLIGTTVRYWCWSMFTKKHRWEI